MSLSVFEKWAADSCIYIRNYITPHLVFVPITHKGIEWLLYIVSLWYHDFFLLFFSFGLTLNSYINYGLKHLFLIPVPNVFCGSQDFFCINPASGYNACGLPPFKNPPDHVNCGDPPLPMCWPCVPCGMPSFEMQQAAFFVTGLLILKMQWHVEQIKIGVVGLLQLMIVLVAYSLLYFGFNTIPDILVGGLVGFVFSWAYNMAVYVWLSPYFARMEGWWICKQFGYRNVFCKLPHLDETIQDTIFDQM